MATVEGSVGRPKLYCRRSCRQRAYEARRRGAELGLAEHELVITLRQLDELSDQLYVLRCAIDDAGRAADGMVDLDEARRLIDWIATAAEPLSTRSPETP
ncbi:MAG: hypothetical protein IT195_02335 [Microthrixaceae bacterium]|nr:hypothetical protein [Microthrixaceae bacterium]